MTHVRLTKEFIIDAISKETRLEAGSFVYTSGDVNIHPVFIDTVEPESCDVCAVGAVMWRALEPHQNVFYVHDAAQAATKEGSCIPEFIDTDDPEDCSGDDDVNDMDGVRFLALSLIHAGLHMNALSMFFEGACHYIDNIDDVAAATVAFVKEHFPDSVVVDIDGARPARDIEVVPADI